MLEKAQELIDGRLTDTMKVAIPNAVVIATVHLVQVNEFLTLVSLLATIGYTAWRWRRERKG